jgi:hypothetical protein
MQADVLVVAVKTGFYTTNDSFAFTLDDIKLYVPLLFPLACTMMYPEIFLRCLKTRHDRT